MSKANCWSVLSVLMVLIKPFSPVIDSRIDFCALDCIPRNSARINSRAFAKKVEKLFISLV